MKYQEFIALVRQGDLSGVQDAVQANPELPHFHAPDNGHSDERTALHTASRHGHLQIVKFLVECGAEVYSHPMCTYPAVFLAENNRHHAGRPDCQPIVDYFIKEIPDKAAGTNGLRIAVNLAARFGWADIVREHIQRDPLAVHSRGWIGDTPMHWACHNGHAQIVSMLLDAGADIEADEISCYGGKPLHWASEKQTHVVELLIERGADVNSVNKLKDSTYFGITPLGMNVLMTDDCAEVTRRLIAAGADTSVSFGGRTLMQIAEEKGTANIQAVLRSL